MTAAAQAASDAAKAELKELQNALDAAAAAAAAAAAGFELGQCRLALLTFKAYPTVSAMPAGLRGLGTEVAALEFRCLTSATEVAQLLQVGPTCGARCQRGLHTAGGAVPLPVRGRHCQAH